MKVTPFVVVERELVRLGRRWQTMAGRTVFAGFVFLIVGVAYTAQAAMGDLVSISTLAEIGRGIFLAWEGTLFSAVVLLTPAMVGQAIIDEKEGHTLELLAMTRLTPRRILWGSMLSRLLMMESLILAVMPVLALVLGFGGVGPLEMLAALVHANVAMLVIGAVSTFLALYSRSVIVVVFHTWFWLFMANFVSSALTSMATLGGSNLMLANPLTAMVGLGAQQVGAWAVLIIPTLTWTVVALGVMHVTTLCFETLALGEREASADDADLSAAHWQLETLRRKFAPAILALVLLSPVLVLERFVGSWLPVIPQLVSWTWIAMVLALGGTMHLLAVRRGALKRAQKRKEPHIRGHWQDLGAHYAQNPSTPAPSTPRDVAEKLEQVRTRKGKVLSPLQRDVWDFPIVWREVATSAHGRIRTGLAAWYIFFGLLSILVALVGELDNGGAALALGAFTLMPVPLLALLLATSSIVGERRAGTLELLCVTPLPSTRIIAGKVGAVGMLLGPGLVLGAGFMLLGTLQDGNSDGFVVFMGIVWFLAVNLALILLCLWRALTVENPSRAWVANLVVVFGLAWIMGASTGVVSLIKPLAGLWSLVVPYSILAVDYDLLPSSLVMSTGFWLLVATGLGMGAARSLTNQAASQ
ncbi:MAG: ABC transporter permease subunit [Deltaproteobacteria bacterium]|nr:ABC transporter permease subunit [Deltaproteobacteria bacterium]